MMLAALAYFHPSTGAPFSMQALVFLLCAAIAVTGGEL